MCDNDRNGVIDKMELSEMLRSLVEIARTTSLSDEHVTELIDGMFQVSDYIMWTSIRSKCIIESATLPCVKELYVGCNNGLIRKGSG